MKNIQKVTKIVLVLALGFATRAIHPRDLDGTGPEGLGSKTGLQRGKCQNTNPNKTLNRLYRNSRTNCSSGLRCGLGRRNAGLGLRKLNRN